MLRKHFIQKNIHSSDIKHIIGHNRSIYVKKTIVVLFFLFLLYFGFVLGSRYFQFTYYNRLFGFIGLFLLAKYSIDFLNLYLDGLVLSSAGITLFVWEWLFEYKTEYFDWDKIVTINHSQKSIWDKIFMRWDLFINLEQWIEFPFENISHPKKQVDKIMRYKEMFSKQSKKQEEDTNIKNKKEESMQIFMEAFWEAMEEFIIKKSV